MIKDCTSVEQGRMLVALGISSSTADKCWIAMESGKDEPALYSLSLEQARENRMTADRFLTDIAKKSKPDALTPAWSLTWIGRRKRMDVLVYREVFFNEIGKFYAVIINRKDGTMRETAKCPTYNQALETGLKVALLLQ